MAAEESGQTRQVHRLERLLEAGRLLLAELDLEAVLEHVLDAAVELTGARYAALGVLNRERTGLERFLTRGISEEESRRIGELPRGRGVLGVLITDPRPLRLRNVGSHPHSYGFPLGHPPMESFLGVPIVIRGEPWGNLYLSEAADGAFGDEDERAACVLADWAAIAIANARVHTRVQERRDELEQAVAQLEATTEIASALAGETDLGRILELIVKRARALTSARGAVVMLAQGDQLTLAAAAGDVGTAAIGDRFQAAQTVGGYVLSSGQPERLTDGASRLQFALADAVGASTGLFVPMLFQGRGVGVLEVFDRLADGPEFSAADERLLQAFATSAAAAVATAQTVATETLQRSVEAQEAERARWARELHDETLQQLAATKMWLADLHRRTDSAERDQAIDAAVELVQQTIVGLRHMITDLRPAQLDEFGLAAALEALTERARILAGGAVAVTAAVDLTYETVRAGERLPAPVETAVYRVAQEALTNTLKHADARSVHIQVSELDGAVELVVADDGTGFDPGARTGGFGLLGMGERIALAGGTLTVDSAPGRGTRVVANIPSGHPTLQAVAGR